MSRVRKRLSKKAGMTLLLAAALLSIIMIAVTSYVDYSTSAIRFARNSNHEARAHALSESGFYKSCQAAWLQFKVSQTAQTLDTLFSGASDASPRAVVVGSVDNVGGYSAGVISVTTPADDTGARDVIFRSVGWVDMNGNGVLDPNEPFKTLDYKVRFSLDRSQVFDYAHFVNNYGWISGFDRGSMIVNGDWRVNGDWQIINGNATVNGSVIASANSKLDPPAIGQVFNKPYKWTDSDYNSARNGQSYGSRMRPAYDPTAMPQDGTDFAKYRDSMFESQGSIVAGKSFGATMQDSNGITGWIQTNDLQSHATLDPAPTSELTMPDLSDFGQPGDAANPNGAQFARSKAWVDTQTTYLDGTANPNSTAASGSAGELIGSTPNPNYAGAFVDVWDDSIPGYKRVSSNGVVSSSTLLVGTDAHPIRIHGPVTVNGDVAIAGTVSGHGTLYASRNVHVLASVKYATPPDFRGSIQASELVNQKADALGLAARGSVILGDTDNITGSLLDHMKPPFTKSRLDEAGNKVPAFDGTQVDSYGIPKYRSLLESDPAFSAAFKSAASGDVAQIDAFVYTNNTFGGTAGWNYQGFTINGGVVCKDEAVAAYSTPVVINYDNRIRDRGTSAPLIDIALPRSPAMAIKSYQDRGFVASY